MTKSLALALSIAAAVPQGAVRLETTTELQRSAPKVWPAPRDANADRSRAYYDGCLVPFLATRSPACVYGDRKSATTVVLFGDSHALQYFPALERIARARGWRLVHLSKAGCPPARGRLRHPATLERYNRACRRWRAYALRRMKRLDPGLIVVSGSTHYHVYEHGHRLDPAGSRAALARGYARTLRHLTPLGRVVAIRDSPRPPFDIPPCVRRALRDLRRCAFDRPAAVMEPDVISRAIASVDGVTLVDPLPELCPTHVCPAVIGDVLVYRGEAHITATYAATMARWLDARL
jgi:SGNH domain-containing protein